MERRRAERITYNLDANIISSGNTFTGSIENVSEDGVEYILTSLLDTSKDFTPDKIITLNFRAPTGETINLKCEVKWFARTSPNDNASLTMGMRIINPPSEYTTLINSLNAGFETY